MADTANMVFEGMEVFIGTSPAPYEASLAIGAMYDALDITSQRTGTDIIESIVMGRKGNISLEIQESDLATFKMLAGLTAGAGNAPALTVGSKFPTHTLRLHHAADGAVTTRDIVFHRVRFGNFSRVSATGNNIARWSVEVIPMRKTDDGTVWSVGYTAP